MSAQPERRQAPRPPFGRAFLALLLAGVITGGACGAITLIAPVEARSLVAWYGGISAGLVSIAAAVVVFAVAAARGARRELVKREADARRLADETLPALVTRMRDGASAETALAEVARPETEIHQRLLSMLGREIGDGERMRAAAMSACANAAGRVQALSTSMLADLRDMEARHEEDVLGDLLKIDHSTAQTGRVADSIAVLTGARSGRRWTKPIVMESILRGAVGRISAYQRVQLHCASTVAVAGYAAEGVMHALAELMDNATNFSPPSERVHVYVEEVQAGVVVTIDDAGLVMGDMALRRAEKAVSAEPLDLSSLSGTRLGLAVVGCLARKHNLTISFRPSARGGTGAVVMIPRKLIKEPRQQPADNPRMQTTGPMLAGSPAPAGSAVSSGARTSVGAGALAGAESPAGPAAPASSGLDVGQSNVGQSPGTGRSGFGQSDAGSLTADSPKSSSPNSTSGEISATPGGFPTATGEVEAADGVGFPTDQSRSARPSRGPAQEGTTDADSASAEPPELPRRRRGATLAQSAARPTETTKPSRPLPDPGTRFGAFRRASKSNADGDATNGNGSRGESPDGTVHDTNSSRGDE